MYKLVYIQEDRKYAVTKFAGEITLNRCKRLVELSEFSEYSKECPDVNIVAISINSNYSTFCTSIQIRNCHY